MPRNRKREDLLQFFADLANAPPLRQADSDLDDWVGRFRAVLVALSGPKAPAILVKRVKEQPQEKVLDKLRLRQQQIKQLLRESFFRSGHPGGPPIIHPITTRLVFRGSLRENRWQTESAELDDLTAAAMLTATTSARRFPFATCCERKCHRVFVAAKRGRPQKYCSATCKARGIPSSAKRAEYVKNYRDRERDKLVRRVQSITRGCKKSARYERLKRDFPGRPRKSLLYLLRLADGRVHGRTRGSKSPKPVQNAFPDEPTQIVRPPKPFKEMTGPEYLVWDKK
jgi:hypothetical protein